MLSTVMNRIGVRPGVPDDVPGRLGDRRWSALSLASVTWFIHSQFVTIRLPIEPIGGGPGIVPERMVSAASPT